jgi:hypothetical protein
MDQKLDTTKIDAALDRAAQKAVHGTREQRSGRFSAPKAFVSYSHDSEEHKSWVLKLASDLRAIGVDVVLDQWDLAPGQDISLFMQKGISDADRVIMVCSSPYVSKSEQGLGGVGFERLIVTAEVVKSIDTIKFIPILRASDPAKKLPSFLGPRLYVDFDSDADYEARLIELAREIHGAPAISKPSLGSNPFAGSLGNVGAAYKARATAEKGGTEERSLPSEWFKQEANRAHSGLEKLKLNGFMEVRAAPNCLVTKTQIELLNAVKQSEIKTFGWPIGITLENRDEFRPRPYGDGIKAEILITDGDHVSFDYWAARSNSDFYLLQSLFEDMRKPNVVFFDTRIVRVTECLMFLQSLYTKLELPADTEVAIRIEHGGLKGRELTSASSNRLMFSRNTTTESKSTSELRTVLATMEKTRADDVRQILEPMFMLFDFQQFQTSVYEEIVRDFEQGIVR